MARRTEPEPEPEETDDDVFDADVYRYLDSQRLKEYYLLSHHDESDDVACPEPQTSMKCLSIFLDAGASRIERVVAFRERLGEGARCSFVRWKEIVEERAEGGQYQLVDVLSFVVTMNKDVVSAFLRQPRQRKRPRRRQPQQRGEQVATGSFMAMSSVKHRFDRQEDLVVDPSLVFFHACNRMYLIFRAAGPGPGPGPVLDDALA